VPSYGDSSAVTQVDVNGRAFSHPRARLCSFDERPSDDLAYVIATLPSGTEGGRVYSGALLPAQDGRSGAAGARLFVPRVIYLPMVAAMFVYT
jgi:hypothetical protein